MTSPDSENLPLPRPLRIFWALNIFLGVLCVVIMRGGKYLLHWGYPYNYPFIPFLHWPDFLFFFARFKHFHQLDFFSTAPEFGLRFMYPAPVAVLYQGFYLTGPHSLRVFFAITLALVLVLATVLGRAMVRMGVRPAAAALFLASTLLFSYPFWFEYLLGNIEICIFLIVAFAILAFLRGYLYLAAALIGLAASMKIFPFVYLALFLSRRSYRQFAFGILVAIISNVFSLWLVCPSIPVAYRGIQAGLESFRSLYMLRYLPIETGFDHSLFGLFKRLMFHLNHGPHNSFSYFAVPSQSLTVYLALAAIGGIALYFLRIRYLPLLNQIQALTIASILLPPTSHDYTLLHLYIPWSLLVLYTLALAPSSNPDRPLEHLPYGGMSKASSPTSSSSGKDATLRSRQGHSHGRNAHDGGIFASFVCYAILFSPESQLIQFSKGWSGQLKAVTLVVLLVITLRQRWETLPSKPLALDLSLPIALTSPGAVSL